MTDDFKISHLTQYELLSLYSWKSCGVEVDSAINDIFEESHREMKDAVAELMDEIEKNKI